jgi:hypothetical protein
MSVVCEEKARLIRQHLQAIDKYFEASRRELQRKRPAAGTRDNPYLGEAHLGEALVEAGRFVNQCRDALLRHIAQHGCID